jgi:hypothetical protein
LENPGKIWNERLRRPSSSTLFFLTKVHVIFCFWNGQGKNEGSEISHNPRYSLTFDGDVEWPHFRRHPLRVHWVADLLKLSHENRAEYYFA